MFLIFLNAFPSLIQIGTKNLLPRARELPFERTLVAVSKPTSAPSESLLARIANTVVVCLVFVRCPSAPFVPLAVYTFHIKVPPTT